MNILAMAKSLTEPDLKQCNTNVLADTNSWNLYADRAWCFVPTLLFSGIT